MSKTIRWDDPSYSKANSGSNESVPDASIPVANTMSLSTGSKSHSLPTTSSWRELTNREGRKYYYNSVTQKTLWEMPQEYREYLEFSKGLSTSGAAVGDELFWAVLRERHVTSKFSWEEALRAIITHPNYKCIPTLQERKASFTRYCLAVKSFEAEEERQLSQQSRNAFLAVLETDARIDSNTLWQKVVEWYGESAVFKAIESSRERMEVFEEYMKVLREDAATGAKLRRKSTFSSVFDVLRELGVQLDEERGRVPDWKQIKPQLQEKVVNIPELSTLSAADLFQAFQEYIEQLFTEFDNRRRSQREKHLVQEYRLRENFYNFLRLLVVAGKISPFTPWSTLFKSHLQGSPEYESFVNIYLYGSTPIDCFYDILEEIQAAYLPDRAIIAEYLTLKYGAAESRALPPKLGRLTRFQEELATVSERLEDARSIDFAFEELFGAIEAQPEPSREQIDAYKHLLKHMNPPISIRDRWGNMQPRLQGREEFEALPEDLREAYFYKYLKWLDGRENKRSPERERERGREERNEKYRK